MAKFSCPNCGTTLYGSTVSRCYKCKASVQIDPEEAHRQDEQRLASYGAKRRRAIKSALPVVILVPAIFANTFLDIQFRYCLLYAAIMGALTWKLWK